MNVTAPGAGILRQGFPTEARIEAPQPQDESVSRSAPVDEGQSAQRTRSESSAQRPQDAPPRIDISV